MKRIIVLGMHRSGATALARMIALLGASTGDPAHLRDTGENTALRKVNEALLEGAGGAWDGPPPGDDWLDSATARDLIERGKDVLAAEFGDAPIAVWKDPRNALTLPFWVELLDEEPVVVLMHRHPAEVAASMKLAYSTRPGHAYALWERYNAAALTASAGLRTIVMNYGQLMSYPAEATVFVAKALAQWDIELAHDPATTEVELSPSRRHHIAPDRLRIDAPVATASQAVVFKLLDGVEGAHTPLALPAPVPEPSPVSQELLAMAASIRQLEAERRERRHNERLAKRAAKRGGGADIVADTGGADDDPGEAGERTAQPESSPAVGAPAEPDARTEREVPPDLVAVAERPVAERGETYAPEATPLSASGTENSSVPEVASVPEATGLAEATPVPKSHPERETQAERTATSDAPSVTALPIVAAPEVAAAAVVGDAAAVAAAGSTASGSGGGGGAGKGKARRARRRSRRAAAAAAEGDTSATPAADALAADEMATPIPSGATAIPDQDEPVGLPNLSNLSTDDSADATVVRAEAAEPTGVPTLPIEPTTDLADTAGNPEPVGLSTFPTEPATPDPDATSEPNSASSAATGVGSAPGAIAGVSIIDLVLRAKQEAGDVEESSNRTDATSTYGDAGPGMPHLRPFGEPEPR